MKTTDIPINQDANFYIALKKIYELDEKKNGKRPLQLRKRVYCTFCGRLFQQMTSSERLCPGCKRNDEVAKLPS